MCSKITFLSSSSQVLTDVHDDVIVPAGTMESIPFSLKQEFSCQWAPSPSLKQPLICLLSTSVFSKPS